MISQNGFHFGIWWFKVNSSLGQEEGRSWLKWRRDRAMRKAVERLDPNR